MTIRPYIYIYMYLYVYICIYIYILYPIRSYLVKPDYIEISYHPKPPTKPVPLQKRGRFEAGSCVPRGDLPAAHASGSPSDNRLYCRPLFNMGSSLD